MDKKSIWHQNVSTNAKAKTIVLIVLGLIFIGLAVLIWANQTGRVSIWANPIAPTTTIVSKNDLTCEILGKSSGWYSYSVYGYQNIKRLIKYDMSCTGCIIQCEGNGYLKIPSICNSQYKGQVIAQLSSRSCSGYGVTPPPSIVPAPTSTTPTTTPTTTQCTSGQKKCDNLNYYGGTPCTCTTTGFWSCSKSPCGLTDPNIKCVNGECVSSTTPTTTSTQCTSAQKKCVGNLAYSTCSKSGTWGSAINCPTGTTCQGAGECVSSTPTTTTPTIQTINLNPINSECTIDTTQKNSLNWSSNIVSQYTVYYMEGKGNPDSGWIDAGAPVNISGTSGSSYHYYKSSPVLNYMVKSTKTGVSSNALSAPDKNCTPPPTPTTPTYTTATPTTTTPTTTTPTTTTEPDPTSTPTVEPVEIPSSPQDFSAEATQQNTIDLSWTAPSDSEVTYYKIYSVNDSGVLNSIGQFDSALLSYKIEGLLCGTKYKYAISANNISGESDKVYAEATTGACDVVEESSIKDQQVTGLTGIYQNGGMITLSWNAVEGATGYSVYDCNGNQLTSTTNTSVVLTGLERDKDYCFYVVAHDNGGNLSQKSDEVTVNTTDYNVDEDSKPISPGITSLVSTGASLWFNILIALIITLSIGYFMFRNRIHGE